MKMGSAARRTRRGIAGIVATIIMFAILFTVGTSYFIFVNQSNTQYVQSLVTANNKIQGSLGEDLAVTTVLMTDGNIGFYVNNTSGVNVNMTVAYVLSSAGVLLKCDGVGLPSSAGCSNTTPTLWNLVIAGKGSPEFDTGYAYASNTDVVKVVTARGNTYSQAYPESPTSNANVAVSSESLSVNLNLFRWHALNAEPTSVVQKAYTANCNSNNCALAYGSSVTVADTLLYALGWYGQSPPSTPTDTRGDTFALGASNSVVYTSTPALVQSRYTSNCNAASCGLAYNSNVVSGNTLAFGLGWANQSPPSAPTDTRGDSFTLGASQSVTVNPPSPSVVQHKYLANCNAASCALAYSSNVAAGNTLVYGLGWPSTIHYTYVPVTITNCASCLPALTVDGSTTGSFTSANSGSATLTTTMTNDIIVVTVANENTANGVLRTVSSVTSTGLSFAHRSTASINSSPYSDTEVWWAYAPGVLSSATITVTLTGSIDDASIVAFGVNGANTASPWDPNVSLPKTATGTSSGNPTVSAVSTTSANDMLLGLNGDTLAGAGTPSVETAGSGYTLIKTQVNGGGSGASEAAAEYKVVSATQSSVSVAFAVANAPWMMIGDAIQQATNSATPSTFQQLVTWNPSTYSAYEAASLSNVRFCADNACATPLNAWLESCSSTCSTSGSSSTSASAWVKLTSSIAANGGTLTIYMVFEGVAVNFDSNYWGEAPQLSGTYAQYDNGANVFTTLYQNFAGSSTPTGWSSSGSAYTINNGLTSASSAGSGTGGAFYTTATYGLSSTQMLDTYGRWATSSCSLSDNNVDFGYVTSGSPGKSVVGWVPDGGSTCADTIISSAGAETYGTQTVGTSGYHVYSTYWSATGSSTNTLDYNSWDGIAATTPSSAVNVGFSIYNSAGPYHSTGPFDWTRIRVYPPNGFMPAIALGSITVGTDSPTTVSDTLGDSFTLGVSGSAVSGATTYESSIWYTTAASAGADTITATFSQAIAGSISIYEITGYSTSGPLSSSGSSSGGSTAASVGSFTPSSNSFAVGNVETGSASTKYTVGTGYTTVASGASGCDASDASQGCDEYETGLGSATTTPFTLSASTPWVDVAMSFAPAVAVTYYSYLWYATAASSGADTITASFGQSVAGSVSVYEISGVTTTGVLSQTGSSSASQAVTAVGSMTPSTSSVVVGHAESTSTTYTAGTGYTLAGGSGSCNSVTGCGEYQTGVGSATTVPMSISPLAPWVEVALAFAPATTNYYSYIWWATAVSSGANTITATFGSTAQGTVSIYELAGYTITGAVSSVGSSAAGSTAAAVASFTAPGSGPIVIGNVETASSATKYTVGGGFTSVKTGSGGCDASDASSGCNEYQANLVSATTVPFTLSASATWVEVAVGLSAQINPQNGQQVGGYPATAVPDNVKLEWSEVFTNYDPQHRSITVFPTTVMTVGTDADEGFENTVFFIIQGVNVDGTGLVAYNSSQDYTVLPYDTPVTLYFGSMTPLASTTDLLDEISGFQATFEVTGQYSDNTLFGTTIPYPTGYVTTANAVTSPTAGNTGATITVSCTNPCGFRASTKATVGWMNSAGVITTLKTFTTDGSGNIPSGTTFAVPSVAAGYYTIIVSDNINSAFMTFQHT